MDELKAKIEAFLFLYGEPVKIERLAKELSVKKEEIKTALESLAEDLKENKRGLSIILRDDQVQLTTKPELMPYVSGIIKEELDSSLTPASLETLSIIAYLGPCGRSLIDYVRGVNSTFMLRSLMIRGLIDRKPDPKRANAYLYEASFNFLKHMGISKPEELADYERYRSLIQGFLNEGERN